MFSGKWLPLALVGGALLAVRAPAGELDFPLPRSHKGTVLDDPVTFGHFTTRWRPWPVPHVPAYLGLPACLPPGPPAPVAPAPPGKAGTVPPGTASPSPAPAPGDSPSLPAPRPAGPPALPGPAEAGAFPLNAWVPGSRPAGGAPAPADRTP